MRLTKIYTKIGDSGTTQLATGERVSKSSRRISAYGTIDELNAVTGMLRDEIIRAKKDFPSDHVELDLTVQLELIQNELFDVGGELSLPGRTDSIVSLQIVGLAEITRLESQMDSMIETLPPLMNFILPGGHPVNSVAHLARTVCRRAERCVVELSEFETVRPEVKIYLNRLSDWFFVVCREVSARLNVPEVLWHQRGK